MRQSQLPAWAQRCSVALGSIPTGWAGAGEPHSQAFKWLRPWKPPWALGPQAPKLMLQPRSIQKPLLCTLQAGMGKAVQFVGCHNSLEGNRVRTEPHVPLWPSMWVVETWGLPRTGNTRWPRPGPATAEAPAAGQTCPRPPLMTAHSSANQAPLPVESKHELLVTGEGNKAEQAFHLHARKGSFGAEKVFQH